MIIHADILTWAAAYDGPLFHALLTDPPYHLTSITDRFGKPGSAPAQFGTDGAFARASRGFMNATWDGGDIAFRTETWAALGRLLHPGAFGMAFASTRGFHRMAVAIEDAGFIIHPMICWNFACLSEDTEILTTQGWEPYHKAIAGTDVVCYNTASESLEWHAVQELHVYDHNDTAYHIRSDRTDQIVTRNHRCLVERSGKFVFRYAQTLERQEIVPILESMPDLWYAVQRGKQRPILQSASLQPGMLASSYITGSAGASNQVAIRAQGRNDNLCVRQNQVGSRRMATQRQAAFLFALLSRQNGYSSDTYRKQVRPNGYAVSRNGAIWRGQSGMEGRGNVLQEIRQLYRREVHQVSGRIQQHGAQGWLCDGASGYGSTSYRASAATLRSGTPQGSQSGQQSTGQPATVYQQPRSQAVRASRIPAPDLATVTPVHYRGKVWCVRVPTGAFVARRNGKIFITGNSGFPKATRLDTQIDRAAGVERAVVGTRPQTGAKFKLTQELIDNGGFNDPDRDDYNVTQPATPLAAAWEGHRYGMQAMKPAIEPIIVFQKPYQGRPVECITRTGAGAINIEASRIGNAEDMNARDFDDSRRTSPKFSNVFGGGTSPQRANCGDVPNGRWPANLVLSHTPACNGTCHPACPVRRLGEQSGERDVSGAAHTGTPAHTDKIGMFGVGQVTGALHDDTGTAARFFFNSDYALERLEQSDPLIYVPKASTAEREAGLVDFAPTTVGDGRQTPIDNAYQRGETSRRNTHPTIKPISLARHLATLLLPPDLYSPRRILVPFAGAGSEMIGAMLAGWEVVQGVELEETHVAIARARIAFWEQMRYKLMNPDTPVKVQISKAPDGQIDMFESEAA